MLRVLQQGLIINELDAGSRRLDLQTAFQVQLNLIKIAGPLVRYQVSSDRICMVIGANQWGVLFDRLHRDW
jgi:hypothetical protein